MASTLFRHIFLLFSVCFAFALIAQETALPDKTIPANQERFNVRDFGAKGDGVTPDSQAIQAALDAAGKVRGAVYFPAGQYLCHDLKVPAFVALVADPSWIYRGEPAGAVLELDSDQCDCLLDITGAFGAHIYGLMLDGRRFVESSKAIHGIFLNNQNGFSPKEDSVVIDDCQITHFSGNGIYLNRVWLFIIRHSQCGGNRGSGALVRGWDGFVTDNQFSGNGGHGFGCEDYCATVMFTANRIEWNVQYGLYLCKGDAWNVTGNSFDRNYGAGICAENMVATTITGNMFRRCGKDSNRLAEGENSCHLKMENCKGMTVCSNVFVAGQDDGGQGKFTPQIGMIFHNMAYSVISSNSFAYGYMDKMFIDLGEHGPEFILKDNVGCPMQ